MAFDIRQILVHIRAVVAEEAPHAGVGIAHILEVDGAVGVAERELIVETVIKIFLAGKADHIPCVDALYLRLADILQMLAADALEVLRLLDFLFDNKAVVPAFTFAWEKADAAEVGVGAYAVVGDAQRHPYSAFAAGPFAYDFHNPRLVGVADGDALARAVVAVFLHQFGHAADCLAGRRRALQRQPHQAEIVEQPLAVLQLQTPVEGALHDGYLTLVHQPHDIVGILHLLHVLSLVLRAPSVDGHRLAGSVSPRRAVEKRAREAEAVAVVAAHHAAVLRGLLADDEVGACHCPRRPHKHH